jgi:hypothetical protein
MIRIISELESLKRFVNERNKQDTNDGLWHVTPFKDKVMAEGLKSRKETGLTGFGGGRNNFAAEMVSLTYSKHIARTYYNYMTFVTKSLRLGSGLGDIVFYLSGTFEYTFERLANIGLDSIDRFLAMYNCSISGFQDVESFLVSANEHVLNGEEAFEAIIELNNCFLDDPLNIRSATDISPRLFGLGITCDYNDAQKWEVEQIAILKVEITNDIFEHNEPEFELRIPKGNHVAVMCDFTKELLK